MNKGARQATVHRVTESQTQLTLSFSTHKANSALLSQKDAMCQGLPMRKLSGLCFFLFRTWLTGPLLREASLTTLPPSP